MSVTAFVAPGAGSYRRGKFKYGHMGYAFRVCSKGRLTSMSPHGRGCLGRTVPVFKSNKMKRSGRGGREDRIANNTGRGGTTGTMPAGLFSAGRAPLFWGTVLKKFTAKAVRDDTRKHIWHSCSKVPPH